MKRSPLFFWTALTFIAVGGGLWAAQSAAPNSSSAAGKTSAAQPAGVTIAPAKVDYTFDDTALDRTNSARVTSYADMLDKVTPAVVSIYTSINMPAMRGGRRGQPGQAPSVPGAPAASTANQRVVPYGVGSGSIISPDGYIVTNNHVISDPQGKPVPDIRVELPDGHSYAAKLVGSDESTDIALLKIDAKNLPTIKLANSEKLRVGDIVFAVGDPMEVGLTVTQGIVSALGRSPRDMADSGSESYIQTDASINPGNSGGPLVDANGRFVGMNTAIYSTSDGGGSIGIGFAIPEIMARHVVDDLIKYGQVRSGFFGVEPQNLDHNLAQALDLPTVHGALLANVEPGKPAASAGLQRGDVVVKMNDQEVDSAGKFLYFSALSDPGDTIKVTLLRDGKSLVIPVKVGDRSQLETPAKTMTTEEQAAMINQINSMVSTGGRRRTVNLTGDSTVLSGLYFGTLSDDLRALLNIPDEVKGVGVTGMSINSSFIKDFTPGDVVMEVNQHAVSTVDDLRAQIKPGVVNVFYVFSEGHYAYVGESMPAQ